MKIQRTHRRKLRFASAKDVAPVVTVKVERAPERPLKRRKRQPRPRRVSPAPTRLESGLPAATWSNIQEHFAAAKSLGEITRIVLQFFSEHEHLQGCSSGPVFPIFVPSSEIYKMKVPRKRRIYDVLHVLEGIGVIKRVRYDERRRTNGGYFLYYGKAAVVQHLAEMKSNSAQVMVDFRKSRRSKRTSTVEEDSALVRVFEDQAAAGKWPCLVTMTVCFLGLLFQQDYQTEVGLPTLSARLGEAKKFIGTLLPSSSTEAPYRDVHRRVYDVVSVLVSCNMIATSPVPSSVPMEKGLRKYVRFNYDIFTDPRILFATPDSVEQWNDDTGSESMFGDMVTSLRDLKSPKPEVLEYHLVSPPLTYWQSLHDGTSSIVFSPVMAASDASTKTSWELLPYSGGKETDLQCGSSSPGNVVRCQLEERRVQDIFSPFGRVPIEKNDWCDESLKQLGLYDALPAEDKIDWELNKKLQENYREMWGCQYPGAASAYAPVEAQPHQCWVGKVEMESGDLECHERLDEDDMVGNTANFFC
ncbi:hypothetical protein PC129_g292 [Phytophthora cactorum]|uniref:E2F/DP family winged-helix DNA-binding domain-containing protein n=1 Tax=Phytophthora cactorum TaxID=29920 RepID=A0A329T1E7_9STRA|nr:hypothetical protein Pcac1_g25005 [Phytophthora cactorum]KAG2847163.1 hypothetical protein PC112_g1228 [Phytophthora cactorum]KAG2847989.1 hypothetical protein PC111_g641 [Phytophthora cactorum]KAG2868345.1 hypothetical protein PC113_g1195 [Phytophthora cactorum]KAG2933285.1 hypothetical protein PC114_g1530 [Phytophthora cactorum]